MITAERARQQATEGYDRAHDTMEHPHGEIWRAGVAYATGNHHWWPWEREHFKPESTSEEAPTMRDLVKAGALIAAEIDRMRFAQICHTENRKHGTRHAE
jgi:hypothetical protein